jgi:hypothetical protein
MSVKDKLKQLADYIELITRRPVVLDFSNGPQLSKPYVTVRVNVKPLAHDIKEMVFDENTQEYIETLRGLALFETTISFWGGEAMNDANIFRNSLWSSRMIDLGNGNTFGLGQVSRIIDTSAPLIDSNNERRATFDVSFYVSLPSQFIIDYFESVPITIIEKNKEYINKIEVPNDEC